MPSEIIAGEIMLAAMQPFAMLYPLRFDYCRPVYFYLQRPASLSFAKARAQAARWQRQDRLANELSRISHRLANPMLRLADPTVQLEIMVIRLKGACP